MDALRQLQSFKELINAIQQIMDDFDPEDSYWMENNDEYANLTPELLQQKIDQLKAERKSLLSLLQISDPTSVQNHLTYVEIMTDLFHAINTQKMLVESQSQPSSSGVNTTLPISSPPRLARNVQAVAPMAPMSTNSAQAAAATTPIFTQAPVTTPILTQGTITTSANQVPTVQSSMGQLVSGPPLMMPMVPNFAFSGMAPSNMAMSHHVPFPQCFMPQNQQYRHYFNSQFSFYNNNGNSNIQ